LKNTKGDLPKVEQSSSDRQDKRIGACVCVFVVNKAESQQEERTLNRGKSNKEGGERERERERGM